MHWSCVTEAGGDNRLGRVLTRCPVFCLGAYTSRDMRALFIRRDASRRVSKSASTYKPSSQRPPSSRARGSPQCPYLLLALLFLAISLFQSRSFLSPRSLSSSRPPALVLAASNLLSLNDGCTRFSLRYHLSLRHPLDFLPAHRRLKPLSTLLSDG